jgi:S-adenosylmethionine hydrolase
VIDLTHQIAPHDIRAGALTLRRAAPWLVPGVILGVVDPGVGTSRRAVALQAEGAVLVGPDNGLLLPAARLLGGPSVAVELDPAPDAPGATFAGRDVFAPAAARAAAGVRVSDLGRPIDPTTLVDLAGPPDADAGADLDADTDPDYRTDRYGGQMDGGRRRATIEWIDRFGNAQLDVESSNAGPVTAIRVGGEELRVAVVGSYGDIPADGVALVVDSYGRLSIACNGASAAARLGLRTGQRVHLCRDDPGRT